jgi:DNA-binding MarR family transcriptional regulator
MKYHEKKAKGRKANDRKRDNISDINDKVVMNLLDIKHTMRSLYEGRGSQKSILILLHDVKKITQRELTEGLGIKPGSVSEVLSKLEQAGLILRTENEEAAHEAAEERTKHHQEMFSCLNTKEKETLLSLLERINDDWDQRYRKDNMQDHKSCHKGHEKHGKDGEDKKHGEKRKHGKD